MRYAPGKTVGRIVLPLIVVGAASTSGFLLGLLRQTSDGNLGVSATPASLDFGEIWEQTDFPWNLVLENPGFRDIAIASFETTCGCTVLSARELTIAAGTSATVPMRIDLSPLKAAQQSSASFDFGVRITPKFREGEALSTGRGWLVHGHVRRPLRLSENRVTFGNRSRLVRGAPMPAHELRAEPLLTLRAIDAWSEPNVLSATVQHDSANNVFAVQVKPDRNLEPGVFRATLWLQAVTDQNEKLPAVKVLVDGVVSERVIAIPDGVDFGKVAMNDVAESTVCLQAMTNEGFRIDGVTIDDGDSDPLVIAPRSGSAGVLSLHKRLNRLGRYSAEATINIRLHSGERFDIKLPVQGYVTDVPLQGG